MNNQNKRSDAEALFAKIAARLEAIADFPAQRARQNKARKANQVPYATFNDRVFASVIDIALVFIIFGRILVELSQFIYGQERSNPLYGIPSNATAEQIWEALDKTQFFAHLFADYAVHYVIFGIVIIWFWNRASCTPGKWALKLRIVDDTSFCKPSLKQWLIRYAAYTVSLLPFTLGFAWIMIDKRSRAPHDIIANTVVVKVKHWRFKDDGKTPHIIPPVNPQEIADEIRMVDA